MVPRKSYRDYNADIYLNTPGPEAAIGPKNWLGGGNIACKMTKIGPPVAETPQNVTLPPASNSGLSKSNDHSNSSQ